MAKNLYPKRIDSSSVLDGRDHGYFHLFLGQRQRRLHVVHRSVVPRQCPRLRERTVAQVAAERTEIDVTPVVDDEARAFLEHAVAAPVAANEVSALLASVRDPDFRVGAGRHGFEAGVGLPADDVLLPGGHHRVGQLVFEGGRLDLTHRLKALLQLGGWLGRYPGGICLELCCDRLRINK